MHEVSGVRDVHVRVHACTCACVRACMAVSKNPLATSCRTSCSASPSARPTGRTPSASSSARSQAARQHRYLRSTSTSETCHACAPMYACKRARARCAYEPQAGLRLGLRRRLGVAVDLALRRRRRVCRERRLHDRKPRVVCVVHARLPLEQAERRDGGEVRLGGCEQRRLRGVALGLQSLRLLEHRRRRLCVYAHVAWTCA